MSDALLSFGLFSIIFSQKLEFEKYFGGDPFDIPTVKDPVFFDRLFLFLNDKWLESIFSIFVLFWFFMYKIAVKSEMEILVKLYSRFNPPHDWERMLGKQWVPVLSIGITAAFLGLAWSVDNIKMFCIIMLFLNILDIRGNSMIRQNLLRHFNDKRFVPLDTDLHKKFIMERRKVAEDYWIWRPQLERIGFMMIGVIAAFVFSSSKEVISIDLWYGVPYVILMTIIAANEYTMGKWRIERDRELERIDLDQEEDERSRTEV